MEIVTHTEGFEYAAAPLRHMEASLQRHLAGRNGRLHLCWNAPRWDMPSHVGHFLGPDPVLCMETPLFGRHLWGFDGSKDPSRTYYRLALHDPSVLYGGFRFLRDEPRLETMFRHLGHQVQPWREPTPLGHIVLVLQVPGDTSLKGIDILTAATWDLYELKRRTQRPVVISVHPDCWKGDWATARLRAELEKVNTLSRTACSLGYKILGAGEKTSDYFADAHCVITYTSGTSFESLLAGIPTITLHRGSVQYPICPKSLATIDYFEPPTDTASSRLNWWAQLAHIQYSWAEIGAGAHLETVDHLLPA